MNTLALQYTVVPKEILTKEQIDSGEELVRALLKADEHLTAALWFLKESNTWTLLLAFDGVDEVGKKEFYEKIIKIIREKSIEHLGFASVTVVDANEDIITLLKQTIKIENVSTLRFSRSSINGTYIEDTLIYLLR